ncbi:MAG TPA: hypothetical protein PLL32_04485 [Anaeromyxobacteraceae bacterium]|nr:hypothetical protein [Anaeromyxobacteraceae bacterium]
MPLPAPGRIVLLALVTGSLACGSSSAPAENDPLPASHDLLFDGDTLDGRSPVFQVRLPSLSPAPLVPALEGHRAVASPDGSRLVVQALGSDVEPPYLTILPPGADAPVRFLGTTFSYEREATWSPDGRRIAFTSDRDDFVSDILVADVTGTELVNVTNLTLASGAGITDVTPSWSPDGRWIAFTSYRGGDIAIWKMRPDGSNAVQLTQGEGDDYFPSWSPDGTRIAFQRNGPGTRIVGIVGADGGTPRFLPIAGRVGNPAWHPVADAIAVIGEQGTELDVRVVTPDGEELLRVDRPGVDRHPSWRRRVD